MTIDQLTEERLKWEKATGLSQKLYTYCEKGLGLILSTEFINFADLRELALKSIDKQIKLQHETRSTETSE
jgi:hypothetical protein